MAAFQDSQIILRNAAPQLSPQGPRPGVVKSEQIVALETVLSS
jgi:hypothetical protein